MRRARPLLGTFVEIGVGGLNEDEACFAIDKAFRAVEEVQRRMSFHDPESMLSRINQHAARRPVRLDEWTFEVLRTAAEVHRVSGGVFDATIAPRLQELGFLPVHRAVRLRHEPSEYSLADVELLPDRQVRFHHPEIRLDLGGIAKGHAVDRAVAALQSSGAPRGLVNAGGDLRVFGEEAFTVSIRHPDDPGASLIAIPLRNDSLATSAHYFADRLVGGSELGPIVDPRSGRQDGEVRSASVRARNAMLADALTKVVMLTAEAALPVLDHFGADAIFVARDSKTMCSPRWHAALDFST